MTPTTSNPNFDTVDDALRADKGEQQGITNKPAAEEERQQEKLPPRGTKKEDPAA